MQAEQIRDRFLGAAVGLFVGEVLGTQFESLTSSSIQHAAGAGTLKMTGSDKKLLKPGEWTDDAAQFLLAVESFVADRGFEGIEMAGRFVGAVNSRPRTFGMHTREVATMLDFDLEDWPTVGREVWIRSGGMKAGNGALARCIAAGLFHWNNLDRMIETTAKVSQLSHYDPRAVESALAVNFILLQCLHGRFEKDIAKQCAAWLRSVRSMPSYQKQVMNFNREDLWQHTNFSPFPNFEDDKDAVVDALDSVAACEYRNLQTTGYCVNTMKVAVWCLLHSKRFDEGLEKSVRLGGEADTQGAIAGALCGARFGLSAIPSHWMAPLRQRDHIVPQAELLLNLAAKQEEQEFQAGERKPGIKPPPVL